MSDVLERIRKAETMPLDADGKVALLETLQDALAEIASLRLSDAEREAIKEAADAYEQNNGDSDCERIADTLHGLLDRIGSE